MSSLIPPHSALSALLNNQSSLLSHLTNIYNKLSPDASSEKAIEVSIATIRSRLNAYFPQNIREQFRFGSSTRGTMLPKSIDDDADIDYMVVFEDDDIKPQAYLDRLRGFVENYYSTSEIHQSNPTIVLSLNHIKFELVPALRNWFYGFQIPAKASAYNDWMSTKPFEFNKKLDEVNNSHKGITKKIIKLMKYWNVINDKPFSSFELEQIIVNSYDEFVFGDGIIGTTNIKNALFYFIENDFNINYFEAQWKKDKVAKLQETISIVRQLEQMNRFTYAVAELNKVFPSIP